MKIVLTGGSSFIGQKVASRLRAKGHDVTLIGRNESVRWSLGESLPSGNQWDVLVHLAHDRSRSLEQSTKDVTAILSKFCGKVVFISTMSAHRNSLSNYGKCKFAAEKLFFSAGACVLKVGMVKDREAEGIYGKIKKIVNTLWFIPLPLLGNPNFYSSYLQDLVEEIDSWVDNHANSYVRASSEESVTLYELVKGICQEGAHYRVLIPLPKYPLHFIFLMLKKFYPSLLLLDSYFSLIEGIPREDFVNLEKPRTIFKNL